MPCISHRRGKGGSRGRSNSCRVVDSHADAGAKGNGAEVVAHLARVVAPCRSVAKPKPSYGVETPALKYFTCDSRGGGRAGGGGRGGRGAYSFFC